MKSGLSSFDGDGEIFVDLGGTLDALLMDRVADLFNVMLPDHLELVRCFAEVRSGEEIFHGTEDMADELIGQIGNLGGGHCVY